MKQSLNTDTLAYQLGMRPGLQLRDMSDLPLKNCLQSLKAFREEKDLYAHIGGRPEYAPKETSMGVPEVDGLVFYMLNHAVSLIRSRVHVYEPLGKYLPILQMYHEQAAVRSARMFFYLLLICTRESRHDKSGNSGDLKGVYGLPIYNFHQTIKGTGSTGAVDHLMSNPPNTTLGPYVRFLADIFYKGYYSGGYGGKAWGAIADVLRDFVIGKLSAEMMMDTAFTLAHNNGPIFNKDMLYEDYNSDIYKMLDVQRSGQIPQLVASGGIKASSNALVQKLYWACKEAIGKDFDSTGYVDWFAVEELGSVKKYPVEKQKQVGSTGYPSNFKAKLEAEKAKEEVKAKADFEFKKTKIQVFPNTYITKTKSPRA